MFSFKNPYLKLKNYLSYFFWRRWQTECYSKVSNKVYIYLRPISIVARTANTWLHPGSWATVCVWRRYPVCTCFRSPWWSGGAYPGSPEWWAPTRCHWGTDKTRNIPRYWTKRQPWRSCTRRHGNTSGRCSHWRISRQPRFGVFRHKGLRITRTFPCWFHGAARKRTYYFHILLLITFRDFSCFVNPLTSNKVDNFNSNRLRVKIWKLKKHLKLNKTDLLQHTKLWILSEVFSLRKYKIVSLLKKKNLYYCYWHMIILDMHSLNVFVTIAVSLRIKISLIINRHLQRLSMNTLIINKHLQRLSINIFFNTEHHVSLATTSLMSAGAMYTRPEVTM